MAAEREKINEVFAGWGNIYFSPGEKEAIAAAHGAEVLTAVLAVYDALMDVGAGPQGMDESLQRFAALAEREYAWLSDKARRKLSHAFVMNWK